MADDFDDFIADLDDNTLQNSALSLSKLLALDDDHEDGGFEKLLGKLNDKDLEVRLIDILLGTLPKYLIYIYKLLWSVLKNRMNY